MAGNPETHYGRSMNSVRGLFLRTFIFAAATAALTVYSVIAVITNGFSGQFAVTTLLSVISVGLTVDLARRLRIAKARESEVNSERGKRSGGAR
jgi:hypothetical protein